MSDQDKSSGSIQVGDIGDNFSGSFSINQNVNQPPPAPEKRADEPEQLSPVLRELRNKLFKALNKHFNEGEVKELCFELGIKYEDLEGETRRGKNRELVDYYARRQKLEELHDACRKARPQLNW